MRDELILALELYMREGRNASIDALDELSGTLRAMPIEQHLAENPRFRNRNAVSLKLYNFNALDPTASNQGLTRGGRRDAEIWQDFADNREALLATAAAIRANSSELSPSDADVDEPEFEEAPEGSVLTRVHRVRERNKRLVERRKSQALAEDGVLACEACGFDFAEAYGSHGAGYVECHHTVPLVELRPGSSTKIADLALVCANCHRMIHRKRPWLSMRDLKQLLLKNS